MDATEAASIWSNLRTTKSGDPVIVLLSDPDMHDGFLSLVHRGANRRRIQVAKAADLPNSHELVPHVGAGFTQEQAEGFLARTFAPLMRMMGLKVGPDPVQKGDAPTTFQAAVAVPALMELHWQAQDGLSVAIRNILLDEEIADKGAAIRKAVADFADFMDRALQGLPALKADDLADVRKVAHGIDPVRNETVQKAGKVISAANMAKIDSALEHLGPLATLLRELQAAGTTTKKADPAFTEDDMDVQVAAKLAGEQAMELARKAGITDVTKLTALGVEAQTEVYKMAVQGPAQPGIPAKTLAEQMRMAGPDGPGPAAESNLLNAINRGAGSMARKTADGSELKTEADAADWLVAEVKKAHDLGRDVRGYTDTDGKAVPGILDVLETVMKTVRKLAGLPMPSSQPGDDPKKVTKSPEQIEKEKAAKADAETWGDSALGNF